VELTTGIEYFLMIFYMEWIRETEGERGDREGLAYLLS
jgi:hypothetical protein